MKEAALWKKRGERVVCLTCERKCVLKEGETGFCKTRICSDGKIWSLVYGEISSMSLNPIEKKPFFHFYPGTFSLTAGTWSCNFTCPWCQNYEISKFPENIEKGERISPEEFIRIMLSLKNCHGTSLSFNEPTLLLEYALELFPLAKERGFYNTFVSNGYMTQEALKALHSAGLDAINIDIKGGKESVKLYCDADVEKVWRNAVKARELNIWVEITTLLIPGVNDSEKILREIAWRIKKELGDDVPWHITRYFPAWEFEKKFKIPPTPVENLEKAVLIGRETGLKYVYIGNVPGHKFESTYCPQCSRILIKRFSVKLVENKLTPSNTCPYCGYKISMGKILQV